MIAGDVTSKSPVPLAEAQEQQQKYAGPCDEQDENQAFDEVEGKEVLCALDKIRR